MFLPSKVVLFESLCLNLLKGKSMISQLEFASNEDK